MSDDKNREGSQSRESNDPLKDSNVYKRSDYKLPSDSLKDGDATFGNKRPDLEKDKK